MVTFLGNIHICASTRNSESGTRPHLPPLPVQISRNLARSAEAPGNRCEAGNRQPYSRRDRNTQLQEAQGWREDSLQPVCTAPTQGDTALHQNQSHVRSALEWSGEEYPS
ncbi:hypothetical protein NDU88_004903 [Pleurodeles waltl]|uniref:Uncharacterized protein n=1 Tax=Pleurodeles waltl TaxID=8319 RepID=A0AAV7PE66_PLEWA|nr:hypothetical protein NDU88_004903 [Pleurodeles waltl]